MLLYNLCNCMFNINNYYNVYMLFIDMFHACVCVTTLINCSQVRMAASIATRQFLTHLTSSEAKQLYLPLLLPAMCLNRYSM